MTESSVLALVLLVLGWVLVSRRVTALGVTGPAVFLTAGILLSQVGVVEVKIDSSTVQVLIEITLVLSLFSDASTVDVRRLRGETSWPMRMLLIGLPLAILAGTAAGLVLLPGLTWSMALLAAAALAATDASLSAGILADHTLSSRVRHALNLESGLNDGLATPIVIAAIAATATALGLESSRTAVTTVAAELLGAVAIGVATGVLGGIAIRRAQAAGWTQPGGRGTATLALAILAFVVAEASGANTFIAAFVAGLAYRSAAQRGSAQHSAARRGDEELAELPERTAEVLSWVTWFIFGAAMVVPAVERIDVRIVAYAVASLTVVRVVSIAISLLGTDADTRTRLFLGWSGPRGLATVVFGLIIVDELGVTDPGVRTVQSVLALTIVLSVVVHGVTAAPTSRWLAGARADAPPRAAT